MCEDELQQERCGRKWNRGDAEKRLDESASIEIDALRLDVRLELIGKI